MRRASSVILATLAVLALSTPASASCSESDKSCRDRIKETGAEAVHNGTVRGAVRAVGEVKEIIKDCVSCAWQDFKANFDEASKNNPLSLDSNK